MTAALNETAISAAAGEHIMVMDGAMGTMIQGYQLSNADYRGKRFADYPSDLKGANDLLNITQPRIIKEIHSSYLEAGADILTTNTFNANSISMSDYKLERIVQELNVDGARLAREAADEASTPERPRFVAGALGPTNRTASISPDVSDPGYRAVTFDEVRITYREAASALIEGGVDLLLLETVFDTLNAKAALFAFEELFDERGSRLPVMVSGTITDRSGRTLTGQTIEAFWCSVRHGRPISIGLNCSFGAAQLRPFLAELSAVADCMISAYPNAGLPNEFGEYDEAPEETAKHLRGWAEDGFVNFVGGCCGTTPDHIQSIADAVRGFPPRESPKLHQGLRLSGLETMPMTP